MASSTGWHADPTATGSDEAARDDLDKLIAAVDGNGVAAAAYEDSGRRTSIVRHLVDVRKRRNLTQQDVARTIGASQSALSELESHQTDPRLSTLQRYARACGEFLWFALEGTNANETLEIIFTTPPRSGEDGSLQTNDPMQDKDHLDVLAEAVEADSEARAAYEDAGRRSDLLRALIRARTSRGVTQVDVAKYIGSSQSTVSDLENASIDPRLSTLQRYARACDMALYIEFLAVDTLGGITGVLAPAIDRASADPLLAKGLELTVAIGIEETLREAIKTEGDAGQRPRTPKPRTRLPGSVKNPTVHGLLSGGWLDIHPDQNPYQRFTLKRGAASFIGVSIREDHVRGIVMRLDPSDDTGKLDSEGLHGTTPSQVVDSVAKVVDRLRQHATNLLGVGVELSGPVDGTTGTVIFAPDMGASTEKLWTGYPLEAEIQQRLNLRTVVANDAKALAVSEFLKYGAPGGLVVVNLSESTKGIGAGLVFNGQLISGADGESGELGHITVAPDGEFCPRCGRGRQGCLETVASGYSIANRISARDLCAAASLVGSGDQAASDSFVQGGLALGNVLGDAVTLLNPADVVIYGPPELVAEGIYTSAERFISGLASGFVAHRFSKSDIPRLVISTERTGPLAAGCVAIDDFLKRPLVYNPHMMAPFRRAVS